MHIYVVNSAVSLVVAAALYFVWLQNREQTFAKSVAWMHVAYFVASVSYWAFLQQESAWITLGAMGLVLGSSALFALVVQALNQLGGQEASVKVTLPIFVALTLLWIPIVVLRAFWVGGILNVVAYTALGTYASCRFWRLTWAHRAIGLLLVAVGLNGLTLIFWGPQHSEVMYSIGTVIRVALGFTFAMAAVQRTQAHSERLAQRFSLLSENSLQGIVVTTDTQLLYANPAALRIFGYSDWESAKAAGPWAVVSADRKHTTEPEIRAMLRGQQRLTEVVRETVRVDGSVAHLRLSSWPMVWDGMQAAQIVVIDDTERVMAAAELAQAQAEQERQRIAFAESAKKALLRANAELEERVQQRTRALEEANQAKSQFLANMSHEVRTPMNVILGLIKLLQSTPQTAQQHDYLHKAETSAKSLLGLLNNLLDFSKIDAGKMTLDIHAFDVDRLLQDLSAIVANSGDDKPVEVLFDVDPTLVPTLLGDSLRILQVLVNLTANAIKFTRQGEVIVHIKALQRSASQVKVRVAIKDTGVGLSAQQLRQMQELLAPHSSPTVHRYQGSGLGLAICRQLLDLMGSVLQVESVLGQGSTFYFDMDLGIPAEWSTSGDPDRPAPEPLRVLMVDDNPIALQLLTAMATALGWRVDAASSGAQAIQCVESSILHGMEPYAAVFLDWEMQGLDGWQTLEHILGLSPASQPPAAVMVSAHGRDRLSERSAREQALLNAYLVKPVTPLMLANAVAEATAGRAHLQDKTRILAHRARRLEGMRILLVDDNLLNRLVASELLGQEGALVTIAEDGRSGVQAVEQAQPCFDVVLMDMQMPVLDGCSATRLIRQDARFADLPIVAMTANTTQADRQACLDAGMNDHVGKPFDINYLVSVLLTYWVRAGNEDRTDRAQAPKPTDPRALLPIDIDRALADMGGDRDLYILIAQAYVQDIASLPERLQPLLDAGETSAAIRLLHTLKGTSATVGAHSLSQVAAWAELHLQAAVQDESISTLMLTLRQNIADTQDQFQALLATMDNNAQTPQPNADRVSLKT